MISIGLYRYVCQLIKKMKKDLGVFAHYFILGMYLVSRHHNLGMSNKSKL